MVAVPNWWDVNYRDYVLIVSKNYLDLLDYYSDHFCDELVRVHFAS